MTDFIDSKLTGEQKAFKLKSDFSQKYASWNTSDGNLYLMYIPIWMYAHKSMFS